MEGNDGRKVDGIFVNIKNKKDSSRFLVEGLRLLKFSFKKVLVFK